jgi:predicted nuclease of predicted toxin-antitoxin system
VNVVVDENIPLRTITWLREHGHVVIEARMPPLRASDDTIVWTAAQREKALLISTDKGFAANWDQPHFGVLIVRLRQPNRQRIHDRIVLAMQQHAPAEWPGLLVVMRDRVQSTRRSPGSGPANA